MILTFEIKDAHAEAFANHIGGWDPEKETANVFLQRWMNERVEPIYNDVVNNIVFADPVVASAKQAYDAALAAKMAEEKPIKAEAEAK